MLTLACVDAVGDSGLDADTVRVRPQSIGGRVVARVADLERATYLIALGRGLSAGLPPDRAFDALVKDAAPAHRASLRSARGAVAKGKTISRALSKTGLLYAVDQGIVQSAERAGASHEAITALGEIYKQRGERWRQLKGRLMLPAVVLLVGAAALPLPAWFAGRIDALEYILRSAGLVAAVFALALCLRQVVVFVAHNGLPEPWPRVVRLLPYLKTPAWAHERARVFTSLALLLRCGVAAIDALVLLERYSSGGSARQRLSRTLQQVRASASVADGLRESALLEPSEGYALVSTAEAAGRLDDGLQGYALKNESHLDDWYDGVGRWLPVTVYLFVIAIVFGGSAGL